jgi:type IV pilus assembly protein PilE
MRKFSKSAGFTLVELMVTLAILAIILAWAVPNFQRQINKARRADAKGTLMGEAQRLERCFSDRDTYLGCVPDDYAGGISSPNGYYSITGVVTDSDYTLTASVVPAGKQKYDEQCYSFTISKEGEKTASSKPDSTEVPPGDYSKDCWE